MSQITKYTDMLNGRNIWILGGGKSLDRYVYFLSSVKPWRICINHTIQIPGIDGGRSIFCARDAHTYQNIDLDAVDPELVFCPEQYLDSSMRNAFGYKVVSRRSEPTQRWEIKNTGGTISHAVGIAIALGVDYVTLAGIDGDTGYCDSYAKESKLKCGQKVEGQYCNTKRLAIETLELNGIKVIDLTNDEGVMG